MQLPLPPRASCPRVGALKWLGIDDALLNCAWSVLIAPAGVIFSSLRTSMKSKRASASVLCSLRTISLLGVQTRTHALVDLKLRRQCCCLLARVAEPLLQLLSRSPSASARAPPAARPPPCWLPAPRHLAHRSLVENVVHHLLSRSELVRRRTQTTRQGAFHNRNIESPILL